jgi:hypothetical protein
MLWMVVREGVSMVAIGAILGLAVAGSQLRFIDAFLFGLSHGDRTTAAVAVRILAIVSFAAAAGPADRAPSVDPLMAMRAE